jgi:hypothetical protein
MNTKISRLEFYTFVQDIDTALYEAVRNIDLKEVDEPLLIKKLQEKIDEYFSNFVNKFPKKECRKSKRGC